VASPVGADEGASIDAPRAPSEVGYGEGVSPSQPTTGSGERGELAQRRYRIFCMFRLQNAGSKKNCKFHFEKVWSSHTKLRLRSA